MKKRLLTFLLAVCFLFPVMGLSAAAAEQENAAVQTARILGVLTAQEAEQLDGTVTRGQFARMLTAASAYKDSVGDRGSAGTLFKDVTAGAEGAEYIRIAVQNGWMNGYTDGTFRPDNPITLEEGCTAILKLLGYDTSKLSGPFPSAQLNKASELGLRAGLARRQGETLTRQDCAVLLYNALTAPTSSGAAYGATLGFAVSGGQVDAASVLRSTLRGPYIAAGGDSLPFAPSAVYRNGKSSASAALNQYDVYYYSESLNAVWIYTIRASGRITAVSPSTSAPTSVTVAGTDYAIGSSAAAYRISALTGGGVGQVVTLLLGMDGEVVGVVTGTEVNTTYYGVVQSADRELITQDGADVLQSVNVLCTDGAVRTFQVDKNMNYPEGWLLLATAAREGVTVQALTERKSLSGTVQNGALSGYPFANDVRILDTTAEGVGVIVRPDRLEGVSLGGTDVRYYVLNGEGEIADLILNDVTGDAWTYGCLTGVTNLSAASTAALTQPDDVLQQLVNGLARGTLLNDAWKTLTGSTDKLISKTLSYAAGQTGGILGAVLNQLAGGAQYTYLSSTGGASAVTEVKYPVFAGGIAIRYATNGAVRTMAQLQPVQISALGAGQVLADNRWYPTADDMQVYLWHMGEYYPTTLANVDAERYYLTGWYDNFGCPAGGQIRLLIALRKD